jgi:hypothetical protein
MTVATTRRFSSTNTVNAKNNDAMALRADVTKIYRSMIRIATKLDEKKRADALKNIRKEFKRNKNVKQQEVPELLTKAESSLAYLRMITPSEKTKNQTGHTSIRFGKGGPDGGKRAVSNWHGSNMDPDAIRTHQGQLKRAGFRDNAHAKGMF